MEVSTDQTENPIGILGISRPGFLAIDEIKITFPDCPGFQGSQVRSRPRFRISLTPPDSAFQDIRQKSFFLRIIAKSDKDRRHQLQTKWYQPRRIMFGLFLGKNSFLGNGPTRTSIFDRPVDTCPTFFCQGLLPQNLVIFINR